MVQNGLVVDSRFSVRKELLRDLRDSRLLENVNEAKSAADGVLRLERFSMDACLLGPSMGVDAVSVFLDRSRKKIKSNNCAFIAVVEKGSDDQLRVEELKAAGVHASLERPYSMRTFTEVVKSSVSQAKGIPWDKLSAPERNLSVEALAISSNDLAKHFGQLERNVPDVLLQAAEQLRQVSQKILEGQLRLKASGQPSLATADALRLVIENALLPSTSARQIGSYDHKFVDCVVQWFAERTFLNHKDATSNLRKRLIGLE